MKVGVLQFFSWPDRRIPLDQVYHRAFQRIDIMEQNGYDAVWLAEHHFSSFSICPSIHMMGTHVAARTKRLRIGTGVSLAPFYNPLRLAEEVALLDVLSGGRVNWGVGRGYQEGEFKAFGVDPQHSYEVFREHVQTVIGAWTEERVTFAGEHFQCEDVEVLPKPAQQPHPPVWLAASSPEAMNWAAGNGFSIMLDPHSAHTRIAEKRELYRGILENHGHSIDGREIPMARLIACAPTRAEAERIARQGAEWTVGSHRKKGVRPAKVESALNREIKELSQEEIFVDSAAQSAIDRYMNDVIIYGTPDELVDEIARLKEEMFLDYLLLAPLSHSTFVQFTDEVLPRVV
jgi:alkanesulfonate monooxygenase SsuD/methylene tetrahydromethanopterin reductase-like flavin-dependent oxidoreductase (luciferase family)